MNNSIKRKHFVNAGCKTKPPGISSMEGGWVGLLGDITMKYVLFYK